MRWYQHGTQNHSEPKVFKGWRWLWNPTWKEGSEKWNQRNNGDVASRCQRMLQRSTQFQRRVHPICSFLRMCEILQTSSNQVDSVQGSIRELIFRIGCQLKKGSLSQGAWRLKVEGCYLNISWSRFNPELLILGPNISISRGGGGGQHSTMVSVLVSWPSCLGSIPFSEKKTVVVAEVNKQRCFDRGKFYAVRTHLVLASGKLVPQKRSSRLECGSRANKEVWKLFYPEVKQVQVSKGIQSEVASKVSSFPTHDDQRRLKSKSLGLVKTLYGTISRNYDKTRKGK